MQTIIQLSDLHFGTEREGILKKLIIDINQQKPDLIIVSGDLTQRARNHQYQAATQFFSQLEQKNILCVPGNHDISLYNLIERLFYPFNKFKRWIGPVSTHTKVENIAILGINSVTPYKPMSGYVTDKQLKFVDCFFHSQPQDTVKIVVMHHNLIKSERHTIINDADKIINYFIKNGVNIVLSGHIHYPQIEKITRHAKDLYVITAGTPSSIRTIEPNSYNVLHFQNREFNLIVRAYLNEEFSTQRETSWTL